MSITQHGRWSVRENIDPELVGLPPHVLVIMRTTDHTEWHEYQRTLGEDTIKATVYEGKILNAVVDTSRVFPVGALLIEINDTVSDPKTYIGRGFNEATGGIS